MPCGCFSSVSSCGALLRRRPSGASRNSAPGQLDADRVLHASTPSSRTSLRQRVLDAVQNCPSEVLLEECLEALRSDELLTPSRSAKTQVMSHQKTFFQMVSTMKGLKQSSGKFGLDIGGTLVKCALMAPLLDDTYHLPDRFGESGRNHTELTFDTTIGDDKAEYRIHFLSGQTERLNQILKEATKSFADDKEHLQVVATGGGAHRFAAGMREVFNVEMLPFHEMESLVGGLGFLYQHSTADEVFTFDKDGAVVTAGWPDPIFPLVLVSMGSGVSILRVDSAPVGRGQEMSFKRLGGTACGGATFLGLARLLTSATTFEEALQLAQGGDSKAVDKLVSDIYGEEGSASLGLPGDLTAAYFGKLVSAAGFSKADLQEADIAASLLTMVVQSAVVLAHALAQQLTQPQLPGRPAIRRSCSQSGSDGGAISSVAAAETRRATSSSRIFFVGGFLARNDMAMKLISSTFLRLGCSPPLFLQHADFLGALGAVGSTL